MSSSQSWVSSPSHAHVSLSLPHRNIIKCFDCVRLPKKFPGLDSTYRSAEPVAMIMEYANVSGPKRASRAPSHPPCRCTSSEPRPLKCRPRYPLAGWDGPVDAHDPAHLPQHQGLHREARDQHLAGCVRCARVPAVAQPRRGAPGHQDGERAAGHLARERRHGQACRLWAAHGGCLAMQCRCVYDSYACVPSSTVLPWSCRCSRSASPRCSAASLRASPLKAAHRTR